MVCDEAGSLTFRQQFLIDTQDFRAWFDPETFGKFHDVDGHKVLGVLVKVRPSDDMPMSGTEGYAVSSARLYVRKSDVSGVNAGQSVRIDGRLWTVKYYDDIGEAVYRIGLEGNDQ
ncbi:MAG: hypothetical protein IJP86_05555 [Synergistaceae bacterium]|nr:hypothetical protein [Synergistaceae bacterium]